MNAAPGWLLAEVAEGLQRLLVLRLDGTPPADAIEGVAMAWADALMTRSIGWTERLDAWRVREGFRQLSAQVTRWPAPAQLWDVLPSRELPVQLPPPPISDEQRARAREVLAGILARMKGSGNESRET